MQIKDTKTKGTKPCKCKAKYIHENNLYCEKHAKSSGYLLPCKETTLTYIKKQKLETFNF